MRLLLPPLEQITKNTKVHWSKLTGFKIYFYIPSLYFPSLCLLILLMICKKLIPTQKISLKSK